MAQKKQVDISGLFLDFQKLCNEINQEPKYSEKTSILARNFKAWKGDVYLLCKLLLCKNDLRKYNIREKATVKILSRFLNAPYQEMLSDLENGDMPETARKFFVKYGTPASKSIVTLKQVDDFLEQLTTVRSEDAQYNVFSQILPKITGDDLKMLMKIIDHDLKINIGPKYVLGALHPDAFTAYRNSNNLSLIVERVMNQEAMEKKDEKLFSDLGVDGKSDAKSDDGAGGGGGFLTGLSLMIPVKPMLAKACHSMNEVISRCPNGMYSEIKYDGERIQIHKKGNEFKCFSRNLKPLPDWKVEQVKEFIPKATKADSIILDGEILLMDTKNHKPLPFGTLGVHKQALYKDACVCVFLFDILFLNGKVLMNKSLRKRRKLMLKHIKPVKYRVEFSEMVFINKEDDLCMMMTRVMQEGLEGLVIKDIKSIYEPGSRHWIKLKKDYLNGMADSADMVVIGANFGSGSKGGLLSTFLMGVYDPKTSKWKTVCKVGNGHDDDTLKELQTIFKPKMNKVDRDFSKVPDWLDIHRSVVPDFIIKDPKKSAVWEVVGSEFTQSKKHTAAAISVRFPRVVRIRDDKDWKTATNLQELIDLSQASKADLKISSSKKGTATKKYKPITTDADESSDSDDDPASKPVNATTSVFKAGKSGSFVDGDADNDDEDDGDSGLGDKGKKGKQHSQKPKISRPPRILYCGDGKEATDGDVLQTNAPKLEAPKKISYMVGDVTHPSGEYIDENMIITHIADDSGKWSNKGVFAAISQKSEFPEEVFKKHPSVLGDAQVVKIANSGGKGNLYVATLIAQHSRSHKLNLEAFVTCLKHLSKFALANSASVHLPKLKMPNMAWSEIQAFLTTYLLQKNIPTYVYTVGRGDPVVKNKQGIPSITKKASSDDVVGDTKLVKKRSFNEDDVNSKPGASKKARTDTSDPAKAKDTFSNPFLHSNLESDEDGSIDEQEEDDEDRYDGGDYEESDEEAESLRSAILEDFVLSQKASGESGLLMELANHGSGDGDDTVSMDSDELDAITRGTSSNSGSMGPKSDVAKSKTEIAKSKSKLTYGDSASEPLKNLRLVFCGYSLEHEKDLSQKAKELGAEVSSQWYQVGPLKCTHLICASATPQYDSVMLMGGSAYTEKWLLACYNSKSRQSTEPYIFHKKVSPPNNSKPDEITPVRNNDQRSDSEPKKQVTTVQFPQIFTELVIYFHGSFEKGSELASLITKHGGVICNTITEDVTHILAETKTDFRLRELCPDACVVTPKWAWDSVKKQALLSERPFFIK